jgi:ABC-type amino acid transport substrate-binding protein
MVTQPLTNEGLRLVALKTPEGHALIEKFNTSLAKIKSTSTYDSILAKWELHNPEVVCAERVSQ